MTTGGRKSGKKILQNWVKTKLGKINIYTYTDRMEGKNGVKAAASKLIMDRTEIKAQPGAFSQNGAGACV